MSRTKIYGSSQQVIDLGPDRKNIEPIAQDIAIARGAQVAESLFEIVLPAMFNKADTEAEGRGIATPTQRLKPLFGTVVQSMWRQARVASELPLCVDRKAVEAALGSWPIQVSAVYLDAAGRKAQAQRLEEARVLVTYAEFLR